MAYKCGNCGKDGHNRRTCPDLTTARLNTELDAVVGEMAAKPPDPKKAKGSHRPCFLCGETDHTPKQCEWAALVRAGNGIANDEDLVIICTRVKQHHSGKLIIHMLCEGEDREVRTFVRDHPDPRVYMGVEDGVGVPVFTRLTDMLEWWEAQADKDGKGPRYHRPAQLTLEYARRAWPHLLTAEPKVFLRMPFP